MIRYWFFPTVHTFTPTKLRIASIHVCPTSEDGHIHFGCSVQYAECWLSYFEITEVIILS
jgi:hypothetical protein